MFTDHILIWGLLGSQVGLIIMIVLQGNEIDELKNRIESIVNVMMEE
jgi:hypothetical protein